MLSSSTDAHADLIRITCMLSESTEARRALPDTSSLVCRLSQSLLTPVERAPQVDPPHPPQVLIPLRRSVHTKDDPEHLAEVSPRNDRCTVVSRVPSPCAYFGWRDHETRARSAQLEEEDLALERCELSKVSIRPLSLEAVCSYLFGGGSFESNF